GRAGADRGGPGGSSAPASRRRGAEPGGVSALGGVAFAALGWEARAALAGLRDVQPADLPRQWRGRLADGSSCLVVQTGMGAARAEVAARVAPPAGAPLSPGGGGRPRAGARRRRRRAARGAGRRAR